MVNDWAIKKLADEHRNALLAEAAQRRRRQYPPAGVRWWRKPSAPLPR